MKKSELRNIIKEEISRLKEDSNPNSPEARLKQLMRETYELIENLREEVRELKGPNHPSPISTHRTDAEEILDKIKKYLKTGEVPF
jgi:NTP pyrophosphatase (non-canonical NTP hydrolase)